MSKLDSILEAYRLVLPVKQNATIRAKQELKNLFKEIVNSSSREVFIGESTESSGPVSVCPTGVLLEKIEEL